MFVPPAFTVAWVTAGVVFVISALLETSVFGSGVGWASNAAAVNTLRATIVLMASMLITRSGGLQTAVLFRFAATPIAALRIAKRLVSWNRARGRSEQGRCEILEAAAYGGEPGALCSLIRICPWMEQNSNSYWSDQDGPAQGQVRLGQLASSKQEVLTTGRS